MSPMILVESAGNEARPRRDYPKINSIARAEYFLLPNIEERVAKVATALCISVIDLTKGYWEISLSRKKQCFCSSFDHFRQLVICGLITTPLCFSSFIA